LRPTPPTTPTADPFDPEAIRHSLEKAFQEADEALFGPLTRSTRSRQPTLPDDIVHRYPSERGKRKK